MECQAEGRLSTSFARLLLIPIKKNSFISSLGGSIWQGVKPPQEAKQSKRTAAAGACVAKSNRIRELIRRVAVKAGVVHGLLETYRQTPNSYHVEDEVPADSPSPAWEPPRLGIELARPAGCSRPLPACPGTG